MVARANAFGKCHCQCPVALSHSTLLVIQVAHRGQANIGVTSARNPTVRRRELGALLRSLRTEAGLTVEQAADRLLCSPSKVSRLETGHRGASRRDIRDLCELYGVEDPLRRTQLETLAREGKQQVWWQTDWSYGTYVGLEAASSKISDFESDVIPGLLQTEEYARAIMGAAVPSLPPEEIEKHVSVRRARQEILHSAEPPQFYAVIDEAVFHRRAATKPVMRAQVQRLLEVAGLPHVCCQLLPFTVGQHPAVESTFIILDYDDDLLSSTVYVETLVGNLYLDRESDVRAYRRVFERLCDMSLSPVESLTYFERILDSYDQRALSETQRGSP
jgi:transcriptional regulator with XRE-family HTH domain